MKQLLACCVLAAIVLVGCSHSLLSDKDNNNNTPGSLTVTITDSVSRSIVPGISMSPESYVIEGSGPNNATFSTNVTGTNSATINDLAFGDWSVTVTAKNSSNVAIGAGTGNTTVVSNTSASVAVTVKPYDGFGTLSLALSWPASDVQTPGIVSTLLPVTGTAKTLDFTVDGATGTASSTTTNVATGYHTLSLKLQDNGKTVMGAVEVVRIVKDQTTSGTIAFTNVNKATGSIAVNISADMSDSLAVAIAGSAATKPANKNLRLSASVSNYADNVTYVWYVNGDAVETGANFTFGNTWVQGYYRIDVTAFSADGKRAGSDSTVVEVTAPIVLTGKFRTSWYIDKKELWFPLDSKGTYNFTIDWGDGSTDHITASPNNYISHAYAANGTYEVDVSGTCKGFGRNQDLISSMGDLLDVMEWGGVKLHNNGYQFANYTKLTGFSAMDEINTSTVTNMSYMFYQATRFNGDLSDWDTSAVTTMCAMFRNATGFNGDISKWNTSAVTDMNQMFFQAASFEGDISNWNTSAVTYMNFMFAGATNFNGDISDWDTAAVTLMDGMFYKASSFDGDLSGWNTSATTSMYSMFYNATSFNGDISNWNTAAVTRMNQMFYGASAFSTTNYDAFLIGISNLPSLKSNVVLDASVKYSSAATAARAKLISTYGWTINDGGQL